MAFEYFVVFNWITFMVTCLRSGIKHSLSRRRVQALIVFGYSLRFLLEDFIASFRIVLRMKCRPTEVVRMYFWLEIKMQDKQPPSNTLQSYLILVTQLSFGETVVHFSLSQFSGGLWLYRIRPVMLSSGF